MSAITSTEVATAQVAAPALRQALRRTDYAMAEDIFPAFSGVLLEGTGAMLTAVATDRVRMSVARIPLDRTLPPVRGIIPYHYVTPLRLFLTAQRRQTVSVNLTAERLTITATDDAFSIPLRAADYPAWQHFTTATPAHDVFVIDRASLYAALKTIQGTRRLTPSDTRPYHDVFVRFERHGEEPHCLSMVEFQYPDGRPPIKDKPGVPIVPLAVRSQLPDSEYPFGLDIRYVLEFLKYATGDTITLRHQGGTKAAIFEDGPDYTGIIQPLRQSDEERKP